MTIAPAATPAASSQVLDAVLRAAAGVTGMQLVFVASIQPGDGAESEGQTYTWRQLHGKFDGILAGLTVPLPDTFDARLLKGAPAATSDATNDPHYADVPMRQAFGIASYVGVPLRASGVVTGVLGGIDSGAAPVSPADLRVLTALGRLITSEVGGTAVADAGGADIRLRRTPGGWEVEQGARDAGPAAAGSGGLETGSELTEGVETVEDLTIAMSLADVIAADAGSPVPMQRPQRPTEQLTESDQLRVQIAQLEHALSARIVIEQAIGVLAQRFGATPREAFDRIRKSARSRGQRVHDLAVSIVRSARDETVVLPSDLTG